MKTVAEYLQGSLTYDFPKGRDGSRLRELLLYVAEQSAHDDHCGAVKTNKILFWADFFAYAISGESITGTTYVRRKFGPVPKNLVPEREKMIANGEIDLVKIPMGIRQQARIVAKRPANRDTFKASELALVDWVIKSLRGVNAADVSELSHGLAWKAVGDGDPIP